MKNTILSVAVGTGIAGAFISGFTFGFKTGKETAVKVEHIEPASHYGYSYSYGDIDDYGAY